MDFFCIFGDSEAVVQIDAIYVIRVWINGTRQVM